jgi:hypothetical protein
MMFLLCLFASRPYPIVHRVASSFAGHFTAGIIVWSRHISAPLDRRLEMAVARKHLTLEAFLQLPEEKPALEYIGGVISRKVSPKLRHGCLQSELLERINVADRRKKDAMAVPEIRTTFGGRSTVPDVSVFRSERMDRSVVAFVSDASVHEWHGSDRIDLGRVVPGFDLTVEQLFQALAG